MRARFYIKTPLHFDFVGEVQIPEKANTLHVYNIFGEVVNYVLKGVDEINNVLFYVTYQNDLPTAQRE